VEHQGSKAKGDHFSLPKVFAGVVSRSGDISKISWQRRSKDCMQSLRFEDLGKI